MTHIERATPAVAGRQAEWITALEPWLGLGYSPAGLRPFLRRAARTGDVFVVCERGGRAVQGLLALQPGFLLGAFVSLLAVKPTSGGRGLGRALMARAERRTFARRRFLFVSADASNRAALRFYRELGFTRVGRLPDLVRAGRTEILLRKARPG